MSTAIQDILGPYIEQMIQEANKKGLEKGRNEEKINNIVDTFKAGLSLNGLTQAFHLSVDEIKEILQQHNLSV